MVAGMDELFLIDRDARRPALSGQERLAVPSASGAVSGITPGADAINASRGRFLS